MMGIRVKNIGYLSMEKHIPNANALKNRVEGVSYEVVKRLWHGGEVKYIPTRELGAIAKVLGVRALDLLEEVED
jgi:DNA-binding Xre family transcriptional regulator